ncbi:hypothetical protein LHYA1_G009201 [Lachnellula hyalina]|uniref:Uncharacterized protein n=1 Tax=Lachnellula hyalina TaxID=1316788 RepID=A0A8H8QUU7_9HELO|nr:uncharacterized protein LHYA1_G009201 [Lachnellula hyalina]TVY22095.1 hypothetical protein LHYA1_G009201 [Lachnellula hyalina]
MKSRRSELVPNLKLSATHFWQWLKLALDEVKQACSSEIKSTSPGPDYITQTIITYTYLACPSQISLLFKTLNNKPDYKQPSAYQPISLLNCLGKVSERILAKRLAYLAETTPNLLHPS